MDTKNHGMYPSRSKTFAREATDQIGLRVRCTVGPAELSARNEYWIWTSQTLPPQFNTNIVDDAGERQKRMETVL
ncbi:unnamed protein product [Strongylus vulgaris]|uniref:Uncharacterized protein n=1 Tax=Strongylus vulgaris TaxID=40348 RepID=A0A3P7IJW1_STRVU|nr:unnamed protein product [Strongylus vulgaris]